MPVMEPIQYCQDQDSCWMDVVQPAMNMNSLIARQWDYCMTKQVSVRVCSTEDMNATDNWTVLRVSWPPDKTKIETETFKGRVERIFFFASFKLPLFNEYEMVFIIA